MLVYIIKSEVLVQLIPIENDVLVAVNLSDNLKFKSANYSIALRLD